MAFQPRLISQTTARSPTSSSRMAKSLIPWNQSSGQIPIPLRIKNPFHPSSSVLETQTLLTRHSTTTSSINKRSEQPNVLKNIPTLLSALSARALDTPKHRAKQTPGAPLALETIQLNTVTPTSGRMYCVDCTEGHILKMRVSNSAYSIDDIEPEDLALLEHSPQAANFPIK